MDSENIKVNEKMSYKKCSIGNCGNPPQFLITILKTTKKVKARKRVCNTHKFLLFQYLEENSTSYCLVRRIVCQQHLKDLTQTDLEFQEKD